MNKNAILGGDTQIEFENISFKINNQEFNELQMSILAFSNSSKIKTFNLLKDQLLNIEFDKCIVTSVGQTPLELSRSNIKLNDFNIMTIKFDKELFLVGGYFVSSKIFQSDFLFKFKMLKEIVKMLKGLSINV